ncbi:MAG: YHS domain-containing protein [Acidobacteriota bacterium]
MAKDFVCEMEVDEKTAAASLVHEGKTYYFCSKPCKTEFEKAPDLYVGKQLSESEGISR